jgi:hypothetical protein
MLRKGGYGSFGGGSSFTTIDKEGSMKKVLLLALVLLLAIPAVSFAGSATSRWDLTIGGYVKVDAGYINQAGGQTASGLEEYFADRANWNGNQNVSNKAGSFSMATGMSNLNFLVKGPDTWGAKTTAFIQGSFYGQTSNNGNVGTRYGTFTLTHAYMDFTWASTKLMVGQNWQSWGFLPSYNFLGMYDLLVSGRGNTVPQISVTQQFGKNFYATLGIQEPYNMRDNLGGAANLGQALNPLGTPYVTTSSTGLNPGTIYGQNYNSGPAMTRVTTEIPDIAGEIGYKSDACGKIGPNMMQFGVGGMWGQDKIIYLDSIARNTYNMSTVNRWASAFKAFVPIIPEKNLNKTGALSLSGSIWTGQNLSNWFLGARNTVSLLPYPEYANPAGPFNYGVPVTTGGWGQLSYYITDKVYANGLFGFITNRVSSLYAQTYPNSVKSLQQYIGNVFYDVNPAVRVAFEYTYITNKYDWYGGASSQLQAYTGKYTGNLNNYGTAQCARIAFFYFF